jgi:membrane dipeptidase
MRLILALLLAAAAPAAAQSSDANLARASRLLAQQPVIDGHNDWAEQLREHWGERWWGLDLRSGTDKLPEKALMTDIARLRAGHVGGQFWSVYVPASVTGPAAVEATLKQIDIVRGIAARYPETFELASTAADVRRIQKAGRIASMMGVEGGSQIDNSLAVLRQYYVLGARYMTLTHVLNNDWADSATAPPVHGGLTDFGKAVVREMNRVGMLVDLSHVSPATMKAAIAASKAPVIFSHSSARALDGHPRNVPDDVLALLPANGGVVMANYVPVFISEERRQWETERAAVRARFGGVAGGSPAQPSSGLFIGEPDKAAAAIAEWEKAHPMPRATLSQVADHIDHIAKVAGHDHVGLGADLDGIEDTPTGLADVSTYPALIAELLRRGWTDEDVKKLTGGNILRVMEQAEKVAAGMKGELPPTKTIADYPAAK